MKLSRLLQFISSAPPTVSVEIAANRVSAVSFGESSRKGSVSLVVEPLPAGVVTPRLNGTNVADIDKLAEVLVSVLGRLPGRPRRVALAVPDCAAKVALVRLDQVPSRVVELEKLLHWQARKTAPFRSEDTQLAYVGGVQTKSGGREFALALMRRDVIEEYEAACTRAGVHAGIVDLSSFGLINAVLASGASHQGDWLLVHAASGYCSLAVVREGKLVLFRVRLSDGTEELVDVVHQTRMYYEDRLAGAGFCNAYLFCDVEAIGAEKARELRLTLESGLGIPVEDVALSIPLASLGYASEHTELAIAPVGLLWRERDSVAASG